MAVSLLFNINELNTCHSDQAFKGSELGENTSLKGAAIAWEENKIIELGKSDELLKKYPNAKKIDADAKAVIPGFIDSHTHLVFGGSRHEEYKYKVLGKSYTDLHQEGGILSTVAKTREASTEQLFEQAKENLDLMLLHGTTSVEAKTGYGLDELTEKKIVDVMLRLKKASTQDLYLTFLGAHTIPKEFKDKKEAYLELVKNLIPQMSKDCDFLDVWCDPLGFTIEETSELCELAIKNGFKIKLHVEQTGLNGGAEIAAKYNAISCDHLDHLSPAGIKALAKSKTIGVLLPSVTYHLMEFSKKIPVEQMIQEEMKLALATDFNPGSCPCLSMQRVMEDACRLYKLDYNQVLNCSTLNAAYALDIAADVGSIFPGKKADFLVLDVDEAAKMIHQFGRNHVQHVYKNGVQVVKNGQLVKAH